MFVCFTRLLSSIIFLLNSTHAFHATQGQLCDVNPTAILPTGQVAPVTVANNVGEKLITSPEKFTRKGYLIQEGAVYDHAGTVICILKHDRAAYLFDAQDEAEKAITEEKKITGIKSPSESLCQGLATKGTKLTIPNGDLLNRLQWSIREGNCNPVVQTKTSLGTVEVPSLTSSLITATYYHGFALNNLRAKYPSEEVMLKSACNSGPGKDYFQGYFVDGKGLNGEGFVASSFKLLLEPKTWNSVPAEEAFAKTQLHMQVRHCMKDLMKSVVPGAKDMALGGAFWHHSREGCSTATPEARADLSLEVKFHIPMAYDTYCCFKNKIRMPPLKKPN